MRSTKWYKRYGKQYNVWHNWKRIDVSSVESPVGSLYWATEQVDYASTQAACLPLPLAMALSVSLSLSQGQWMSELSKVRYDAHPCISGHFRRNYTVMTASTRTTNNPTMNETIEILFISSFVCFVSSKLNLNYNLVRIKFICLANNAKQDF